MGTQKYPLGITTNQTFRHHKDFCTRSTVTQLFVKDLNHFL